MMPTADPERLARAIRLLFAMMDLKLSARATPALRFVERVDLDGGTRGLSTVDAPAVLLGEKIAIRVEPEYYRVYNLEATPYHGLFHHGVCKTTNPRHAIQAAVMAAIHEHFTKSFESCYGDLLDDLQT